MRRLLPLLVFMVALAPVRAEALTIRDILDLTRAGLGEDILLALIEVDRRVYPVDAGTIRLLKEAGVSERVILAIVRSGRIPPPEPPAPLDEPTPPAPQPQVVVVDHQPAPTTIIREVAVPVPVYVPVFTSRRPHTQRVDTTPHDTGTGTIPHTPIGLPHSRMGLRPEEKKPEPVYWGWGGKLRPDAWKPN